MNIFNKSRHNRWHIFMCVALFIFVIFTSQCFAQSQTKSSSNSDSSQYMQQLTSIFDFVERNYVDEVDAKVLFEGALKGLMDSLGDPFSYYLDASALNGMNDTTTGNFGGVGLTITKAISSGDDKGSYVEVVSALEGTPGERAGIKAGDLIISIDGTDTSTINMEQVLKILRGTVGTKVSVVIRRGENMELPFTLERALIEVPTVKYGMIGKTGYLRLIEFTPLTAGRVQEALDSFKEAGYDSLILDLRNNPGGILSSAIDIADKFIDNGVIVSTKSRIAYENSVKFASPDNTVIPKGLPVVVLINHDSASCSEVLSGALKDSHVAYLVGERSYGKGSVQIILPMPNNIGIRLTIAKYYSPSDSNIHKIGIPPDLEIKNVEISKDDEIPFQNLIKDDVIVPYVKAHADMSEEDIASYAETLHKTYPLDLKFLRRLIRVQVYHGKEMPLYDSDYDSQLAKALEIVHDKNYAELVKNTKTLKQLENERLLAESAKTADASDSSSSGGSK
ncbi:MAG: S41 family peptidase [Treponema sp.]|nr:S41 family peptidase [Treponema sp.]